MRRGVTPQPNTMERSATAAYTPKEWVWNGSVVYAGASIPLQVPLYLSRDEVMPEGSGILKDLLQIFNEDTMRIYNAVLSGQRVLFVGYNHAAGDVCKFAMAAASMISPPLEGILHRVFPYANLTDLSFIETQGFIAGVTNPVFEENTRWWDLLCVLNLPEKSGVCMTVEEKLKEDERHHKRSGPSQQQVTEDKDARVEKSRLTARRHDALFIEKVLSCITVVGDDMIKSMFHDYTRQILQECLEAKKTLQKSSQQELMSKSDAVQPPVPSTDNARVLRFLSSGNAKSLDLEEDPWAHPSDEGVTSLGEAFSGAQLRRDILCLQTTETFVDDDIIEMFERLDTALQTEASLQVMLTLMTESAGGLHPIASGLLHSTQQVRLHALSLLRRLSSFPSTRASIASLNQFWEMAYQRAVKMEVELHSKSELTGEEHET
uniref:UDENN domain-containing protein n=1 Tax=Octactis speculum TaxID=3111310 RepID=A0A7S2E3N0_9STRA